MKKFRNLFLIGLMLLMILPQAVGAAAPYKTYTYSPEGELLNSPNAYVPDMNVDSEFIDPGLNNLGVPFDGARDLFVAPDGKVYIADTANNRIIVLTKYYKLDHIIDSFDNDWMVPDRLSSPNGVFVNEDHIYICDTNNSRIVRFLNDGEYTFDKVIDQPESNLFEEGSIYKPIACAVDQYGRIFVVSSTTYQGVIVINDEAEFFGFIGAQSETLSPLQILWRRFQTEEQREQAEAVLAKELNNITIDDENFIYVTTSAIEAADLEAQLTSKDVKTSPIKKLNASGTDVLKRNGDFAPSGEVRLNASPTATITGPSKLVDVAIGPVKTWSIIDENRSKIYTYDENGNLLFAFGDKATATSQVGSVAMIGSIAYQDSSILVMDTSNDCIVVYRRTEYGDLLINALQNDADRKYDMAEHDWTEILKRNINYSMAYLQLGKAAARAGEYDEAMDYFKKIKNTEDYSAAYKEVRSAWASKNFWIIPVVIVVALLLIAKFFSYAAKVNHRATLKIGRKSIKEEVLYAFHVIFHPFDGFWDLKHEKRGSMKSAVAILLFTIIAFFYKSIGTSYIFSPDDSQMLTVVGNITAVLVPLLLWVIANWCITTLFEGEGSMKDIFIASCYALTPLPIIMIPTTIISNFLVTGEAGILTLLYALAFVWLGLLLVFGMMVTHDYSLAKNILACIATIVGMVFLMFIAVLFSTLMTQIVGFISDIITEISFRS